MYECVPVRQMFIIKHIHMYIVYGIFMQCFWMIIQTGVQLAHIHVCNVHVHVCNVHVHVYIHVHDMYTTTHVL